MKIALVGYFGYNNLGDEAILQSTIQQIRMGFPSAEMIVLSATPEAVTTLYGVQAHQRQQWASIIAAIEFSDILLFPGGSLFQDNTSFGSLLYYLAHIILAMWYSKRIILYSQGFSQFRFPWSKWLFKSIIFFADRISVRDQASFDYLKKIRLRKPITIVRDSALNLIPLKTNSQYSHCIGLNLRSLTYQGFVLPIYEITAALTTLLKDYNVRCLFLAFSPEDREIGIQLQKLVGADSLAIAPNVDRPSDMLSVIDQLDGVIGMRLHCLIFATTCEVPFIGITYDPKVRGFAQDMKQPCLELNQLTKSMLIKAIHEMVIDRSSQISLLKSSTKAAYERAISNELKEILTYETRRL